MSSTRDRDRLRIEQLRRLGWEHVRVWSTDLFRSPARDVARVRAAVLAASDALPDVGGAPVVAESEAERPQESADTTSSDTKTQAGPVGSKLEQTRDDTDAGWGERPNEGAHDQWLQEQRPPHWG
jgi:hypothetical protein